MTARFIDENSAPQSRPKFGAAIFDMDGLLIDSERPLRDAWLAAARSLSLPLDESDYMCAVGVNDAESKRILCAALGSEDAYDAVRNEAAKRLGPCAFAPMPGAQRLLASLAERGVACAVASSTRRAEVLRRLDVAGLRSYVKSISGGDEVSAGRGKPNPDIYELAAKRLCVKPAACLAFEDSEPGACAALAAGICVIIVPNLKQPGDQVVAASLMVLQSLNEALPYCAGWFERGAQWSRREVDDPSGNPVELFEPRAD